MINEHYKTAETILHSVGINPTANRILILSTLLETEQPMSIADIGENLETVDQSTIFRAITTFEAKQVVLCIDDGTKSPKYELKFNSSGNSLPEYHAHFYCHLCKNTKCLPSVEVDEIPLPKGYKVEGINFVVKGICAKCQGKKKH